MASVARPPPGESLGAYHGAPYTFGLTDYGVNTPAYEAGTFLPPPFYRSVAENNTKYLYFPKAQKKKAS